MQSEIGMAGNAGPTTGLEPGTYSGEYSWEWAELRRLHRKFLITVAGIIAIFGLFAVVVVVDDPGWIGFPLALGLVVAAFTLMSTLIKISYWLCPRCGKEFHGTRGTLNHMSNPFARRCVHCHLPKWVESDPDPKLKRALYPFRTDQIYKLGDINKKSQR